MNKYPEKVKVSVVNRYINGETISKISHDSKISRTTIYAWIKEYNNTFHNGKAPNFRYLHDLQQKCERQQKIIEILQRWPCALIAPLSKRYEVIKVLSAEYNYRHSTSTRLHQSYFPLHAPARLYPIRSLNAISDYNRYLFRL